jgi:CBS domain-containing protein
MKVEDGMSEQILTIGPAHTLREAARVMAARKVGAAVVVDCDHAGVGILTDAAGRRRGFRPKRTSRTPLRLPSNADRRCSSCPVR